MKQPKERKIDHLLELQDKGFAEAEGILSKMARLIMCAYGVTPRVYEKYLQYYIANNPNPKKKIDRGNFNKNILSANMSWNGFLSFLSFLKVTKLQFKVVLWQEGKTTGVEHTLNIDSLPEFIKRRRTKEEDYY